MAAISLLCGLSFSDCGDANLSENADDDDDDADENDAGRHDSGTHDSGTHDAGPKDSGRPDTGGRDATTPSDDPKLSALAGRYLIRLDTIGDATSPTPLGMIGIHSLVSTLVVAELKVNGQQLSASERVCTQTIRPKCTDLCTAANSSVDSRVIKILHERRQQRTYTLAADGTFSAGRSVAQLGYDDEQLDAPAPQQSGDERIWDVDDRADLREGFRTTLTVTVGLPISCTALGTQKFVSSFSGKLSGPPEAPEFPVMALDLGPSEGFTVGSMPDGCAMMGAMASVDADKSNARMIRYEELRDDLQCPDDSVFDNMLPPTPL